MKLNKTIIILTLFIVLLCAIGSATASEDVNGTDIVANDALDDKIAQIDDDSINEEGTEIEDAISDGNDEEILGVDGDEPALSENESGETMPTEKVIWVGHTNTTEGGNGTEDNPFSTLSLACSNVSGEDKITLNIYSGTYYLGSELKFNTSNLIINGIDGVVIKSSNKNYPLEAFELTSTSSNFTMNNIIFDASDHTKGISVNPKRPDRSKGFLPFYGIANEGIFNNCTFTGFKTTALTGWSYNSLFSNCIFDEFGASDLYFFYDLNERAYGFPVNQGSPTFKNCMFLENTLERFVYSYNPSSTNCSFIECWFGQNEFPNYLYVSLWNSTGANLQFKFLPVYSYAIFSVYENYLGNNQYEIVGKLTWNGTDNQDGMENFQPMTVNLVSTTGDINQTATLVNGNFRTIYTSSNPNHKVTATLHNEEIELVFTTVNITADPVSIYYGDDQNITFNFTQPITANVTVTVSNGSYTKSERVEVSGKDSLVYTVPDTLKEGTYDVEINLAENNLFGSNTTTLTVSKVSDYTFNIDIQDNGNVKADDNLVITVELPEDVSGNVTVKVNDNPEITKEATPNTVITINNLVGGNNNITIAYTGNDKYAAKTSEPQVVTAQKASAPNGDNALNITAPADSATPTYSINMPKDATGNLTVIVDGKDKYTKELVNGSATITLPELSSGKHDINVTYSGDAKYESISKTTSVNVPAKSTPAKTPVAKKAATKITAKKKTFKAKKKVKKYTITLKSGKKPVKKVWVTLKIKGKKLLKAKTNAKGKATFKIKKLTKKGKYKAVIKFKGNKNYKASSKKVKITIKK